MLIYFGTFAASAFFLYISELFKRNRAIYFIFLSVSIILPCLLASQRGLSVGSDTKGYINGMYELAVSKKNSLLEYLAIAPPWYAIPRTVVGYISLTWVCAQFGNGLQILLFLLEFLTILPIYLAIKKVSNNTYETVFGYVLFLLFFFNITFNAARQSVAIAFYVLAFVCMMQREYKKTIICSVIAFLFHDTAVIIVAMLVMHYIIMKAKTPKKQKKIEIIIVFISILAVAGFYPILELLVRTGIYSHGSIYLANNQFNFSFIKTGLYLLVYFVIFANKSYMVKTREDDFYKFLALLSLVWLQEGALIRYAERLSWYLVLPVLLVYLPQIAIRRKGWVNKRRGMFTGLVLIAFIVYWIVLYGILNEHGTVPYEFFEG